MDGGSVEWIEVCAESEIPEDDVLEKVLGEREVALYKVGGRVYATEARCSHEGARLCQGLVSGDTIECPKHNARFHIPSGKVLRRPATRDLVVYAIKVEGAMVFLSPVPMKKQTSK